MIITGLTLCDPVTLWSAMRSLPHINLEKRADKFWLLGRRIPTGSPVPVLTALNSRHLQVEWLPTTGLHQDKLGSSGKRAVIPFSAVQLRHESSSQTRMDADLRPQDPSQPMLIAAEIISAVETEGAFKVKPVFIGSMPGRSDWIPFEPLVLTADRMTEWLFSQANDETPSPSNHLLIEQSVRPEMR